MNTNTSIPSHEKCITCGIKNESGSGLEFLYLAGRRIAMPRCAGDFSYPGIVHGGIWGPIAGPVMVSFIDHLFVGELKARRQGLRIGIISKQMMRFTSRPISYALSRKLCGHHAREKRGGRVCATVNRAFRIGNPKIIFDEQEFHR